MTIYANKTTFLTLGLELVAPSNALMYQDCYICKDPLHVLVHTTASDGNHPAVRIRGCGHMHGQECLEAWLDAGNTCPTCNHMLFKSSGHSVSQADINSVVRTLRRRIPEAFIMASIARLVGKQESAQARLRRMQDEEQQRRRARKAPSHLDTLMDDDDWADSGEEDFDMDREDGDGDFLLDEEDSELQSATS